MQLPTAKQMYPKALRKEPRDSQRQKLYDAERANGLWTRWDNHRLETVALMQAYANALFTHPDIRAKYGIHVRKFVEVKDGRRCRRALGGRDWVKMPRWSRSKAVLCHELAHSITTRLYDNGVAAHGAFFCEAFLDLVKVGMTADYYEALRDSFDKGGVRYRGHEK